ncbi:MAG: MBOAT family O-acyltransferase [Desulfobacterales bacterium]
MLFNSLVFIVFITIVFLVYPRLHLRAQNIFLLIASYVFYGYWDWRFTFLLLISTVVDFWVGRQLKVTEKQRNRKFLLLISIAVNLGILGFFKYFNFFVESASSLLTSVGFQANMPVLQIILPIGISFYTFKTLTYTIDIYRRQITPTKDFIAYALFTSFFPQILAGPIERAANLLPQIATPRQITRAQILTGFNLILLGFFKKVAIADTLAPIVAKIFLDPFAMTCGQLWSGVYAYTFQIYGDFSGYTDIARGLACVLGFKSMENFNTPYLSKSVTEFWRKWHISLSTWFLDYLYIPLGGNRLGKLRTYTNLFITMLLCGLWHGAAWPFVIWGIIHGLYLIGHRIILKGKKAETSWPHSFSGWLICIVKIFITFHLVALAWVLFRSSTLDGALVYYTGLFSLQSLSGFSVPVLFAGILIITLDIAQTWIGNQTWIADMQKHAILRYTAAQFMLISVLAATIAHLETVTPFIYFQF